MEQKTLGLLVNLLKSYREKIISNWYNNMDLIRDNTPLDLIDSYKDIYDYFLTIIEHSIKTEIESKSFTSSLEFELIQNSKLQTNNKKELIEIVTSIRKHYSMDKIYNVFSHLLNAILENIILYFGQSFQILGENKKMINIITYLTTLFNHNISSIIFEYTLEQEQKLQLYKEAIDKSTMLIMTDLDGKIHYINDLALQKYGYNKHEVISKKMSLFKHPDTPNEFYNDLWNNITNGIHWTNTLKNKTKLNEDIYVKSFILPIKDNTGNIIEYMALQTDITISSNNKYDLKDFSIIKCDEDKNINFIDPNIKKYFVNPLIKLNIKDEIISELSNNNIIQDILIIEDTKITCILIPIINKQQLKEIILVVKSIEIIEMNENKIFIDDINKCINI